MRTTNILFKLLVIIPLLFVLVTEYAPPVLALSGPQVKVLNENILYYNVEACSPAAQALVSSPSNTIDDQAAQQAAQQASTGSTKVGYGLYDSNGNLLASYNGTSANYGASITKSMLLVAYLKQVGSGTLSAQAKSELTNMIENSDNASANWVYSQLSNGPAAVKDVANSAGMSGFVFNDSSDPIYLLGQSQITANDFARFFAKINTYIPSSQRQFGLNLLANLSSADQNGLLQAGLPGTVYSKEGWKPEPAGTDGAPYVVNQAAQFTENGTTYGVGVTVSGTTDQSAGETIVKNVVSALAGSLGSNNSSPSSGSGSCCSSTTETGIATATSGSVSSGVGKGMSQSAQQKFQEIVVAAGNKFNVDPNFVASFYYTEMGRTGDSTNNADAASGTPVTGDGNWVEPAPPIGTGSPYVKNSVGYWPPYGLGDGSDGSFNTMAAYGQDGDGDGKIKPNDLADAAFTAANLLASDGAKVGANDAKLKSVAFLYNHTDTYAQSVMNTYNYLKSQGDQGVSGSVSSDCGSTPAAAPRIVPAPPATPRFFAKPNSIKASTICGVAGINHIVVSDKLVRKPASVANAASSSSTGNPGPVRDRL